MTSASSSRRAGDRRSSLNSAQAIVVGIAFSLLLAGTNAINPLLPVYREHVGFSPLMVSLTFVCYVGVLTAALLGLSRPGLLRWAPQMLCSALALVCASDVILVLATGPWVLVGRGLAGIGIALGTGAASALVVAAAGPRGRAITATGNLAGAVIGTTYAQVLVAFQGADAIQSVFSIHAAACMLVLAALTSILYLQRGFNHGTLRKFDMDGRISFNDIRTGRVPIAVGCLAWITVSGVIVFLPSAFNDLGLHEVGAAGAIVFLVASTASQLQSVNLTRLAPWISGVGVLLLGVVLILIAAGSRQSWLALCGFGLAGAGMGIAYRLAMIVFTKGANPTRQGALVSAYTGVTYASSAVTILLAGAAGSIIGLSAAALVLYALVAVAAVALLPLAPRLRDGTERVGATADVSIQTHIRPEAA